jgi:hypothetical protein
MIRRRGSMVADTRAAEPRRVIDFDRRRFME